jgi:hypothetical protein
MDGLMSLVESTDYAGFKIKEWNIVQFSKLSGVLSEIAKEFKDRDLAWSQFSEILNSASESGMLDLSHSALDLVEPFIKRAPLLIGISCNADAAALEKLSYTDGLVLIMLVMKCNMEHLSRFFGKLGQPINQTTTVSTTS